MGNQLSLQTLDPDSTFHQKNVLEASIFPPSSIIDCVMNFHSHLCHTDEHSTRFAVVNIEGSSSFAWMVSMSDVLRDICYSLD